MVVIMGNNKINSMLGVYRKRNYLKSHSQTIREIQEIEEMHDGI